MTPVRQRAASDCGVAALASFADLPYEDAYVAIARIEPRHRGKRGLFNREIVKAAALLRHRLEPTRRFDLSVDEGVLRVRFCGAEAAHSPGGHFVAILKGFVLDPHAGTPCPWREYFAKHPTSRACTLLRAVPVKRRRAA